MSEDFCVLFLHEIWSVDSRGKSLKNAPKSNLGWGSAPDPAVELTALPQLPYLDLRGRTSTGRVWEGRVEDGGDEGEGCGVQKSLK